MTHWITLSNSAARDLGLGDTWLGAMADIAGDYVGDFDLDAAANAWRDAVNATMPHVVIVGEAIYCPADTDLSHLAELAREVDAAQILAAHARETTR